MVDYDGYEDYADPGWLKARYTAVVFDPSFADARPTSTYRWFSGRIGLTSITGLTYLNTSEVTVMSFMFDNCYKLTTLDLSGFDTRNVTYMNHMFTSCEELTTLDLSSFDTRNVTDMNLMFSECEKLKTLDLSSFDTRNVKHMRGMFQLCQSLETLDLSSFDTRSLEYPHWMFWGCKNLRTIFVSHRWTTESVVDDAMCDMFLGCHSLVGGAGTTNEDDQHSYYTYAHIDGGPDNPGLLTKGRDAYAEFDGNSTLTFYYDMERNSREGTTYELNDGDFAPDWVYDGNGLSVSRVVFNDSFAGARPTSTSNWFAEMENLETIEGMAENLNTSQVKYMDGMFYYCPKLKNIDLSRFDTRMVENMYSMFYRCTDLTSLDLSAFDTGNVTDMNNMFGGCSLKVLDLSSFDTRKVENMAMMFLGNTELTTIFVGDQWSTAAVTTSVRMFHGCTKLVGGAGTLFDENNVDAAYAHIDGGAANPGYLSLKPTVEAYAEYVQDAGTTDKTDSGLSGTLTFYYDANRGQRTGTVYDLKVTDEPPAWYDDNNYRNVTKVVFDPSFADARPTTGYRWFDGMVFLESITGMNDYLNTSEMTSMTSMFESCIGLDSLDLSTFDTHNVTDMVAMFSNCYCLKYLDLSSFDTRKVTNMARMFFCCQNLEWLSVSSFDTQNVWFMQLMFSQCTNLTNLDLTSFNTAKVTDMNFMFEYCYQLAKIFVGDDWNMDNVESSNRMFNSCFNILGMLGTAYDENNTDGTYAHIDGGATNPGYLSRIVHGDVNLDGTVGIGDIVAITNVMAGIETNKGIVARANVNGDELVGIGDIVAITNIMAGIAP